MSPYRLRVLAVVFGLVVVAGVVVFLTAPPVEVGWFAYAPLSEEATAPAALPWSAPQRIGAGLVGFGVTGVLAVLVARRRSRRR